MQALAFADDDCEVVLTGDHDEIFAPSISAPKDAAVIIRAESAKWARVIRRTGVKAD